MRLGPRRPKGACVRVLRWAASHVGKLLQASDNIGMIRENILLLAWIIRQIEERQLDLPVSDACDRLL